MLYALSYAPIGMTGFEPATFRPPAERSDQTELHSGDKSEWWDSNPRSPGSEPGDLPTSPHSVIGTRGLEPLSIGYRPIALPIELCSRNGSDGIRTTCFKATFFANTIMALRPAN